MLRALAALAFMAAAIAVWVAPRWAFTVTLAASLAVVLLLYGWP